MRTVGSRVRTLCVEAKRSEMGDSEGVHAPRSPSLEQSIRVQARAGLHADTSPPWVKLDVQSPV
jgi:hypothetical protein